MPELDRALAAPSTHDRSARRTVDVLDVSDLRFPGGTSHSIAEEVTAQAHAGYTTGLVTLNGPLVARVSAVNPLIRRSVEAGHAALLIGREPVHARVVVVRHPAVLQHAADQLPPVHTDHVVIVANAGPSDIDGHEHYDPGTVHEIAHRSFGTEPIWAPIGPLVRAAIAGRVPRASMTDHDWVNIIDVDAWQVPAEQRPQRPGRRGDADGTAAPPRRPVVGRHSRSSPQKWPSDPATLRAVYPDDGSWTVRVLGGAEPAEQVLGRIPQGWEVLEFGTMSPRDFLASLDFFVYFHNPNWVEAFGRTILEALATGVPAVLPPHFEPVFADAALYAEPHEVRAVVESMHADPDAYAAQASRALRAARERFGHEAHVARLERIIGAPSSPPVTRRVPTPSHPATAPSPAALFISSNGAGMGHLTRLLAYALRCRPQLEPHFFSLSQAAPVVASFGLPYQYLPSAAAAGLEPGRWHRYFATRVAETIERVRPRFVVFDGTWPYEGISMVRSEHPDIPWVWSRRGLWRSGKNREQLKKAEWFDLVIEPGDLASPADRGVTATAPAHRVGPVTLLDPDDLDDRTDARRALGLDPSARLALVSLGAGNINDTSGDVGAAVAALRQLDVEVCVTRPEIAVDGGAMDDVHLVREFPLSRYYHAFDLAISATGYNSFHELLRFGVPSLFVPNRSTALDDQHARARFAAGQGWVHQLDAVTTELAVPLLGELLERGEQMVKHVADVDPGNGAADAAARLAELAGV
ncbi:glycosyl transferase family 28 [Haloactinopolyspora alba]|uniref:Glycosyl transferase family 28 n=1 Tax=Haloactinopolyspora alba TaxID=648780 RepID=A0A2P8D3C4_9ACTN|nr:glycosyltransferase [Haloactinopolyspora alba]PSK91718.1 glycosyl transferase family 28 [Haloactinopolyspora alba]